MRTGPLRPVAALLLLALHGCGGASAPPETARSGGAGENETGDGSEGHVTSSSACAPPPQPEHPSYTSDALTLELEERGGPRTLGIPVPPFQFEVSTTEDLPGSVEMELTIYDPDGHTHVQRFRYHNMEEACDPYCLPAGPINDCRPRRCWMERSRPRPIRIDPSVYESRTPGTWTFVLHRLDDDDRVSVARVLFEGPAVAESSAECDALPPTVGEFTRARCQRGIVPLGTPRTSYWGLEARYGRDGCRVNAFALPLDHSVRTAFFEGPYGVADERALAEGTVREVHVGDGTIRAWLAHHHLYIVAAASGLEGFDDVVNAFLEDFPVVTGPIRAVPACRDIPDVESHTIAPITSAELTASNTHFFSHFEGNRPAGAWVLMDDAHPLARAGLRRHEIIQSVNGERVRDRRHLLSLLEGLARGGGMEIVVSRRRVRHPRCLKITVDASAGDGADQTR